MRRPQTVIRIIKLGATKTLQGSPKAEITVIQLWRYASRRCLREGNTETTEKDMEGKTPSIIDLNAEVSKLKMFRRTPGSTAADRKGSVAQLASYRDGLLHQVLGERSLGTPSHRR